MGLVLVDEIGQIVPMGDIVNLRTVRRRRDRAVDAAAAADNRARHGRTKAEIDRDRLAAAQAERLLDGARLEQGPPTEA
jgi:hypothetical protein